MLAYVCIGVYLGQGVLPDMIASVSNEAEITEIAITLPEDEFVLMACDGLWDVLTSQEVTHTNGLSFRTMNIKKCDTAVPNGGAEALFDISSESDPSFLVALL